MDALSHPKHEHVLDRGERLAGCRPLPSRCATCGRRIHDLLEQESGSCVVRPGWTGAIAFTQWAPLLCASLGRA